uniref:Uncharacterized protein AlNc14C30G2830 n=1 Tax=Albugo laibachii Nc14 TaxID=890382 RepID=F0W7M4_9STRA|nr:conserved hypothetical protein [Albugo laibachii Nc14]|eukprot:CCA17125.1 conserved hypothetical protein [Albugo laibachii Nc14]
MHINALCETPSPDEGERAAAPQWHSVHQKPGYGLPHSKLQHLYTAAMNATHACVQVYHQHVDDSWRPVQQMERVMRYPEARQKNIAIRMFDEAELYEGIGFGFLEWGHCFESQVSLAQSACGFL